ncbi:MAG: VWA domain-containing protein [Gammaproteobacteria bacterium]|nr:VWA domain-containing protein [Gammaproteobacteria bacterium]MDH3768316.1 VWA domain-containing protein [Gammaproteobacteria bacterium]
MLVEFFFLLKKAGLPVSITEFLALLAALEKRVASADVEDFYYLARACLIKDERHYDRYDQVFAAHFQGAEMRFAEIAGEIPLEWLRKQAELMLSEEEKQRIEALGGWEELMQSLRDRLAEQDDRHQGGNKWIGTAGTSPFGAHGYNPEGVRIGQEGAGQRSAVKIWDKRAYRNLDDSVELGTRNIKLALRRLRRFAREGAADELDLDDTINATARNAGWLDIKMVPERHNAMKLLLFFDVGGSMDPYVRVCEELFSAVRSEFKHMEYFYFHNFVYENLWKDNYRRHAERTPTYEVLRTFSKDYRVIFVGDAMMSPYEITVAGGSIEHWNEESGLVWMQRVLEHFPFAIWLNPEPVGAWKHIPSARITRELMQDRMFPLTLEGLDAGVRELKRNRQNPVTLS